MLRTTFMAALLAASVAFGTPEFPTTIQTKYSLSAAPAQSCALCHTNGIPGVGTVNTPIGKALRARGLVSSDVASLNTALDALAADAVDSDGDGVTDVAELMAGTNPNVAEGGSDGGTGGTGGGGGTTTPPPLRFGCGAEVVPGLLIVALLPILRRRRR